MTSATMTMTRPDVGRRLLALRQAHSELFGSGDTVAAYAPGRAEILGNHTDYNEGYGLSANVQHSVLVVARRRADGIRRFASLNRDAVVEFCAGDAAELLATKASGNEEWANYPAGVVWAFLQAGLPVGGFDAVFEGDIPPGGLSASAALELATAHALVRMYDLDVSPIPLVELCHSAESSYVGVPCGYLDQATVGLADQALLLSYRPVDGMPFSYEPLDFGLAKAGWLLVVGYDLDSAHTLTDGRYAERRRVCEQSVPVLAETLGRPGVRALRDVSAGDLRVVAPMLEQRLGPVAVDYVTHVVTENERVLAGREALRHGDFRTFGRLMSESGHSAIHRYRLADGSPELRFCYDTARAYAEDHHGVAGMRNMGGGFNATTLTLVRQEDFPAYADHLGRAYEREFGRPYTLLPFTPAPAAAPL